MTDNTHIRLTLYGHRWCHLCDDMERALEPLRDELGFDVVVVDIADDPALESRFGSWVPVLMAGDRQLCHYFLDPGAVRAYLADIR
ncbi:MAG: glutaredoxin family protein [Betaproteobacteria bacterium]|nr:glutaredoxin family protein [Betaproteobacteria bacterium]